MLCKFTYVVYVNCNEILVMVISKPYPWQQRWLSLAIKLVVHQESPLDSWQCFVEFWRNQQCNKFNLTIQWKMLLLQVCIKNTPLVTHPLIFRIHTCVFHSSSKSQQRRAVEENESPEYGSGDVKSQQLLPQTWQTAPLPKRWKMENVNVGTRR